MNLNNLFELVESIAAAVAIVRLIYLRLAGRFPGLLVWLTVLSCSNLFFALVHPDTSLYFYSYLIYLAIYCVTSVFAVRELFEVVFTRYAGIRTAGRLAMYWGVILAVTISLLAARIFQRTNSHGSLQLYYAEVIQRSVVVSLAIVIITVLFFLSRYPLNLGNNSYVSSALFSILFLSDAARLLIDSLAPYLYNHYVDRVESVFTTLCLMAWGFFLARHVEVNTGDKIASTAHEDVLLAQLNSLNALLGRAANR